MKNSDSDYKAEDEGITSLDLGSASDSVTRKIMIKKMPFSLKMTKKEIIEKAMKNFLPDDVKLTNDDELNEHQYEKLMQLEEVKEFSLNFKIFLGKIVHVTDGDTVKAAILLNGKFTRFTFRLSGIDTPETRKGEVRDFGKQVKKIIKEMLFEKIVRIEAG